MNITGIITEYNPLHSGHKYHIDKSKELTNADGLICIMSGSFMQRGIPAIIDKWNRTEMALANGVDLVIELPTLYSASSAEFFSFGAVSLLNSLGLVDAICFGSECGDASIINTIAEVLAFEPLIYKNMLKNYLAKNISFAQSRSLALQEYLNNNEITNLLNSSNNILGIEYCKSLLKLNSSIKIHTLTRLGADYNSSDLHADFSSATAIRAFLKNSTNLDNISSQIPLNILAYLNKLVEEDYPFTYEDAMLPYLKYKVSSGNEQLNLIPDATEGLHNRIKKAIEETDSYSELIHSIKSKRYAYTRISRILCQYFIGFEKFDTKLLRNSPCPYGRILGFNAIGAKILRNASKTSVIPLYTKMPRETTQVLDLDIQATKVYSMLNNKVSPKSDFYNSPIRWNI